MEKEITCTCLALRLITLNDIKMKLLLLLQYKRFPITGYESPEGE